MFYCSTTVGVCASAVGAGRTRAREGGREGGYTVLRCFVRHVSPTVRSAVSSLPLTMCDICESALPAGRGRGGGLLLSSQRTLTMFVNVNHLAASGNRVRCTSYFFRRDIFS